MRIARSAALALTVLACVLVPPDAAASSQSVVTRPVVFSVRNVNRTPVSCSTDGAAYQVRGLIVGPAGSRARSGGAATLYLHGLGFGVFFWDFSAVPGYDFAAAMAAAGHVSVIIDRLGYGASDHPIGTQSCIGGQADIAHQIVQQLRAGTYSTTKGEPISFARIALVGHSAGGAIAQVESYSFRDVDALGVLSWADQGSSTLATTDFLQAGSVCMNGGETSDGAPGYAPFGQTAADFDAAMFFDADPAVVAATNQLRNLDPCGDDNSIVAAINEDHLMVPTITVPVLLVFGANDALFPPPAGTEQEAQFLGSSDVSLLQLPNTGHALTLERSAPTFTADISRWLAARGF
jgi:pimeloyl-ACP methyl ester carboxylesterase